MHERSALGAADVDDATFTAIGGGPARRSGA